MLGWCTVSTVSKSRALKALSPLVMSSIRCAVRLSLWVAVATGAPFLLADGSGQKVVVACARMFTLLRSDLDLRERCCVGEDSFRPRSFESTPRLDWSQVFAILSTWLRSGCASV